MTKTVVRYPGNSYIQVTNRSVPEVKEQICGRKCFWDYQAQQLSFRGFLEFLETIKGILMSNVYFFLNVLGMDVRFIRVEKSYKLTAYFMICLCWGNRQYRGRSIFPFAAYRKRKTNNDIMTHIYIGLVYTATCIKMQLLYSNTLSDNDIQCQDLHLHLVLKRNLIIWTLPHCDWISVVRLWGSLCFLFALWTIFIHFLKPAPALWIAFTLA